MDDAYATPVIDQYGGAVACPELGLGAFEQALAAAGGAHGTPPRGAGPFDGPLGRAVRRWCPPLLGLEPHCAPVRYLVRRRELGGYAAARRLLRGAGLAGLLAHHRTGGGPTLPPDELAGLAGCPVRETTGLLTLAREVADTSGSVQAFLTHTAEALHGSPGTAAFVLEAGPLRDPAVPDVPEVRHAVGPWLDRRADARTDVVTRHLAWAAVAVARRPLQLRCGDAAPLADFLAATAALGTPVVLLPDRPNHRAAARLAARFPHVYADVGPDPAVTLSEAPAGKLLFSSHAGPLPELHVVAAMVFRAAVRTVLSQWVRDGRCSRTDAVRAVRETSAGTARRLYGLENSGAC